MWQTLLNSFTFGHNVALGRLGSATPTEAEEHWQRRLDLGISLLATPLALPIASLAELLAAAVGRGGRLRWGGVGRITAAGRRNQPNCVVDGHESRCPT